MATENIGRDKEDEVRTLTAEYDCDLVESPPDDLVCKICYCLSRDAQQTNSCCGQNFCKTCLERFVQSTVIYNNICPFCRQANFSFVADIKAQRQILNLMIHCANKELGCTWTGALRSLEQHLNKSVIAIKDGCPFSEVQCSSDCGVTLQRRLLEHHLNTGCQLRQVSCEYCNIKGSHRWITGEHQNKDCKKYPLTCPNCCDTGVIRREEMKKHLEVCPFVAMACPFSGVGCKKVLRRDRTSEHIELATIQHMECNRDSILHMQTELKELQRLLEIESSQLKSTQGSLKETQEKLDAKQGELDSVKQELRSVKEEFHFRLEETNTTIQQLQEQFECYVRGGTISSTLEQKSNDSNYMISSQCILLVKVSDFQQKRRQHEGWYSQSFYTSERGYQMRLYFNVSGIGKGRGSHVSVGAFLMKGDNDDNLTWPIKGTLHAQLLNQIADSNHVDINFEFGGNAYAYTKRVQSGSKSSSGCYCDQAVAHRLLGYNAGTNTQYLKDDALICCVVAFIPFTSL